MNPSFPTTNRQSLSTTNQTNGVRQTRIFRSPTESSRQHTRRQRRSTWRYWHLFLWCDVRLDDWLEFDLLSKQVRARCKHHFAAGTGTMFYIDLKLILWSVLLHSKFCNLLCASDFTCTDVWRARSQGSGQNTVLKPTTEAQKLASLPKPTRPSTVVSFSHSFDCSWQTWTTDDNLTDAWRCTDAGVGVVPVMVPYPGTPCT